MVEFHLHRLPDKSFHITGYSRQDPSVLEFNDMVMVEPKFCHRRFDWMSKPYVQVVFFYSDFYRTIRLSDVHLTTLAGYAVNPWRLQFQVILRSTKETGYLPRRQDNKFKVLFGQHSAEPAVMSSGYMEEE